VDKTTLVEADIQAGGYLIQSLEKQGIDIDVAAWLQESETGVWQLVISSPRGGEIGVRPVYEAIRVARSGLKDSDLDSDNVLVASPHERLIRDLKRLVRTGDELQMIRLYDLHLGSREFTSARIYRVRSEDAPDGWIEDGARVRVKSSGQFGTVRGALETPAGKRYLVLYDHDQDSIRPLNGQPRSSIGQDYPENDLDFLYAVRPGGWPEKPPLIARPA
jgi:hypothetical protein